MKDRGVVKESRRSGWLLVTGQLDSSELTLHHNLQGFSLKSPLCVDASGDAPP